MFKQPCAAWINCRCAIYQDRPKHCRKFECLLLKAVAAKALTHKQALKLIRLAQRRTTRVRKLLRALGQQDESSDLRSQYRTLVRRMQSGAPTKAQADLFSGLTLEFHALDQLLRESFYEEFFGF